MYPFWIYKNIPGKDLHRLKNNGVNITFHGDYVRFIFPNCEILSESRKILIGDTNVSPSSYILLTIAISDIL